MMPRLAMIALLLASCLAGYALVDLVHVGPSSLRQAEITGLRQTLADYEARLEIATRELAHLDTGEPRTGSATYPGDAASAALWLQGRIRQLLAEAGAMASASQTASTPLPSGHDKVAVTLRAELAEDGLFDFLANIETGSPLLVVEAMTIEVTVSALVLTATIFVVARHASPV